MEAEVNLPWPLPAHLWFSSEDQVDYLSVCLSTYLSVYLSIHLSCVAAPPGMWKFPGQGWNPQPHQWQHQILNLPCHKRTPLGHFFFFPAFVGPHFRHMEVPRLGVESKLQLPAYTRATATPDPSLICNLHHFSQQCWILNPLSGDRDWTCNLMDTSWILLCCTTMGIP